MMQDDKYSIWLMPSGRTYSLIREKIELLSKTYNSPLTEPHITILGSIDCTKRDAIEKTKNLASQIRSFEVSLNGFGYANEFYESLFLNAKDDGHLKDAREKAMNAFGIKREGFSPHLSLFYGEGFSDVDKRKMIKMVGNLELSFLADKLHVYLTNNRLVTANKITTIPIGRE